jgi:hypothetical protein
MDSLLSFPVRLFHPPQHAGLSRRSPSAPSLGRYPAKKVMIGFKQSRCYV